MTIDDYAEQVYGDYESPSDLNEATISAWLEANIGLLNLKLNICITIDTVNDVFVPDLTDQQWVVYKALYNIYYLNLLINRNLGASAYDWSSLTEADSTVRRVSKNEIAKTYRGLMNDAKAELEKIVFQYRFDASLPISIGAVRDFLAVRDSIAS